MKDCRSIARIAGRVAHSVLSWGNSFLPPRGSQIPKDAKVEQVDPEGTDLDIRIWESYGKLYGIAFQGKADKPLWYNVFHNESGRSQKIKYTIADRKREIEEKQKWQEQRRQFRHYLKVGDILSSSWGYDQTNVDFYQVLGVTEKSVQIREIDSKIVKSDMTNDYVVAVPNSFKGPAMLKLVSPGNYVKISSFQRASKWSGQPKRETNPMFGH